MTDDAPAFVNAWTDVMSKPGHHLLCNWHVDKAWRDNLDKIKGKLRKKKQSEVYQACQTLMEILDEEEFLDSLEGFVVMCEEDPDTKTFGEYFEKHYAGRPEKWAYCYQKCLGLNTNMFLEAMNKRLKYCYMQRKQNKRVDKCIGYLMRFSRDMMIERTTRMIKNKPTYRMQRIAQNHRRSKEIKKNMIKNVGENEWTVESATPGRGPYTVSIDTFNECSGCPLTCPECHVCVHQFTCTCIDYQIKANFCKHLHACLRVNEKAIDVCQFDEEEDTSRFEIHSEKVIQAVQGQSVHIGDSISPVARFESLLNILSSLSKTTAEETVSKALPTLERMIDTFRLNQNQLEEPTVSHFSELPSDLPSHKNVERQRCFRSTKKSQTVPKTRVAKPTDAQKASIKTALDNFERSSEVVSTSFDHTYDSPDESSKQ